MKKDGSILIEVVASIMILSVTTTFVVTTSIQNFNMLKHRILQEDVEMACCNLMKEFKYNLSTKEIQEILSDSKLGLKYEDDFSKKLIEVPIAKLERGTDIEISEISNDQIGCKLKIKANISRNNNNVMVEKEFVKSWWMDEA